MIDRKYLKNYTNVMLKSLDMYSDETVLKLAEAITSEERLLNFEKIIASNPTEEELLIELDNV